MSPVRVAEVQRRVNESYFGQSSVLRAVQKTLYEVVQAFDPEQRRRSTLVASISRHTNICCAI
jgi:hypothetical protein